jgi:hypothetical protein
MSAYQYTGGSSSPYDNFIENLISRLFTVKNTAIPNNLSREVSPMARSLSEGTTDV